MKLTRIIVRASRIFTLGCLTGLFLIAWEEFLMRREWRRLVRDNQHRE